MIAGATASVHLPPEMLQDAQQPLPAIVSPQVTAGAKGVGVGGTFTLVVEGYAIQFRVADVRDRGRDGPEPDLRRRLPRPGAGTSRRGRAPDVDRRVPPGAGVGRAGPAGSDGKIAPDADIASRAEQIASRSRARR